MSKVIARFLVASAFCLMPVLTSAQDAAVPVGVGETLQAQPVLDRPEIIADSASSDRGPYGELAWAPLLDDLDAIVAAEAADDSQAAGVDLAVADAFDTDSV